MRKEESARPRGMRKQGAGRGCWSLDPVGMQRWTEGAVILKTRTSNGWIANASKPARRCGFPLRATESLQSWVLKGACIHRFKIMTKYHVN